MFSVSADPDLIADLYDAGTIGIIEHDGWLEAFFEDAAVAARFGTPVEVEDRDWVQETRDAWPPVLVGKRFFLVPPWCEEPAPPGRLRLEMNPGLQCGTGQHPCTKLCLEAMEQMIRPGDSVLDVGTGSGILSIAAKLLGAGLVVACDIDPDAARMAPFFVGSVDAIRSGSFDVVVANISDEVVGAMRPDLERVARQRILSGFTDDDGEWTCVVC
jgi:ribosomal protein L11 methyltransferase